MMHISNFRKKSLCMHVCLFLSIIAKNTDCFYIYIYSFVIVTFRILYNVLQEDTISINHNWLNGCNIDIMWQFLQNELLSVQKEISEWRNTMDSWHQHCQVLWIIVFFLLEKK